MDPLFLSLDEVLEVHAQKTERYGDQRAFVIPPDSNQSSPHRRRPSVASSCTGRSRPWRPPSYSTCLRIGGNKRVGANAAITFLWEPTFDETELGDLVLAVAFGGMTMQKLIYASEARCHPSGESSNSAPRV